MVPAKSMLTVTGCVTTAALTMAALTTALLLAATPGGAQQATAPSDPADSPECGVAKKRLNDAILLWAVYSASNDAAPDWQTGEPDPDETENFILINAVRVLKAKADGICGTNTIPPAKTAAAPPPSTTSQPPPLPPVAVGPPVGPTTDTPPPPLPPVAVGPPVGPTTDTPPPPFPPVTVGPPVGPITGTPPAPGDTLTCNYTDASGQQKTSFTTKDPEFLRQGCPPTMFPGLILVGAPTSTPGSAPPGGGPSGPLTPPQPPPAPPPNVSSGPPVVSQNPADSPECAAARQRVNDAALWVGVNAPNGDDSSYVLKALQGIVDSLAAKANKICGTAPPPQQAANPTSPGSSGRPAGGNAPPTLPPIAMNTPPQYPPSQPPPGGGNRPAGGGGGTGSPGAPPTSQPGPISLRPAAPPSAQCAQTTFCITSTEVPVRIPARGESVATLPTAQSLKVENSAVPGVKIIKCFPSNAAAQLALCNDWQAASKLPTPSNFDPWVQMRSIYGGTYTSFTTDSFFCSPIDLENYKRDAARSPQDSQAACSPASYADVAMPPACESKPPFLPWGGAGSASITVSGGKACGVGWHDTGATILDSMTVTSQPAHGTLKPQDQHVIVFTPAPGYKGQDSFMLSMQEHNGGRRATLKVKVSVTIQ